MTNPRVQPKPIVADVASLTGHETLPRCPFDACLAGTMAQDGVEDDIKRFCVFGTYTLVLGKVHGPS